jgi:AcrR family transcriptional regulator
MGSVKPRPYRLQQRKAGVDETRSRIVAAAREVLGGGDSFSIEAVAREARVARLTVYDRFGTREALLEAVFDDLAESGGLTRLPEAFTRSDPIAGLEQFVAIFCGFYSAHRVVLRHLRALEVLGRGVSAETDRNPRRLEGLRVLLGRIAGDGHADAGSERVALTVHALTGFAFVDELAGADGDPVDVASQVVALVRAAASLDVS